MQLRGAYLLHVLCDGVLLQELGALARVETFCVSEELTFEVLFVHGQRGAFGEGVLLVQAQLDCRRTEVGLMKAGRHGNIHIPVNTPKTNLI